MTEKLELSSASPEVGALVHRVEVVGYSVQGRELVCHLFSRELQEPSEVLERLESVSVETLFIGAFHGDEAISADLMERLIEALLIEEVPEDSAGFSPEVSLGFRSKQSIAVVPVFNPDGLAAGTRVNANGVDLNRNYPTENWSAEYENPIYHPGKTAGSEPETQVMIRLIQQLNPKKIITVHSPYRVNNYDGPAEPLANAMAAENGYPVTTDIGYPTPGSFGSYTGIERGIAVVTLELPDDDLRDEPDDAVWNAKVWEENKQALFAAMACPV